MARVQFTGEQIVGMSPPSCNETRHCSAKAYLVNVHERPDLIPHALKSIKSDSGNVMLCHFCLCQPLNLVNLETFGERVAIHTTPSVTEIFIPETELFRYVSEHGQVPAKPATLDGRKGVVVPKNCGIIMSAHIQHVPARTKTFSIRNKKLTRYRNKPLKAHFDSLFHVKPLTDDNVSETSDNASVKSENDENKTCRFL